MCLAPIAGRCSALEWPSSDASDEAASLLTRLARAWPRTDSPPEAEDDWISADLLAHMAGRMAACLPEPSAPAGPGPAAVVPPVR